ncbi:1-(5-phosphoribosyl)-5-[(5-phosphoribosylamino)methylideneamino]imidazole-4-carboxamide isomerase [Bacillus massiliigorillae]|uniref:1-(5-phosphoribosyl)-5-[(5- phosphoribosylamino)methylideneamino]imidazole-4- carboxamide isomerase n=1 Tax=Bacillus massiliigorillae TaxID=1243664 RepID=UPI00039C9A43|nr:1-(5-phosphoribosyl)-5-[(5-phosphoribosylamino)methylideneamino]imidazole-4-carboxamide isomerase [Bacillus massiliigorillae]
MSTFTIYPAIDMRGGKCVRLFKGDYNQETVYGDSPFEMAKSFVDQGAEWIHMVDLDGAKEGRGVNHEHVVKIAKELQVNVQIGGGIRTEEDIAYYLENGVKRVILGSVAVSNVEFTKEMLKKYGSAIAIGLDAKDGMVATHGWLETSKVTAIELGKTLAEAGAEVFIFTDIATDGTLSGPNVEATELLAKETGKSVIASGGISSLEDITDLSKLYASGVSGSIVGKAIYSNRFTVAEALACVKA